jgi:hypothetical protein
VIYLVGYIVGMLLFALLIGRLAGPLTDDQRGGLCLMCFIWPIGLISLLVLAALVWGEKNV